MRDLRREGERACRRIASLYRPGAALDSQTTESQYVDELFGDEGDTEAGIDLSCSPSAVKSESTLASPRFQSPAKPQSDISQGLDEGLCGRIGSASSHARIVAPSTHCPGLCRHEEAYKSADLVPASATLADHWHSVRVSERELALNIDACDAFNELSTDSPPSPVALIDIRPESQRLTKDRDGAIIGALIMDAEEVSRRFNLLSYERHATCCPTLRAILICVDGQQSTTLARVLREQGLPRAVAVSGGFTAWTASRRLPRIVKAHWFDAPLPYPATDDEEVPGSDGEEDLRLPKPNPARCYPNLYRRTSPSPSYPGTLQVYVEVLVAYREAGLLPQPEWAVVEASRLEYLRRLEQNVAPLPRRSGNMYWAMRRARQ